MKKPPVLGGFHMTRLYIPANERTSMVTPPIMKLILFIGIFAPDLGSVSLFTKSGTKRQAPPHKPRTTRAMKSGSKYPIDTLRWISSIRISWLSRTW